MACETLNSVSSSASASASARAVVDVVWFAPAGGPRRVGPGEETRYAGLGSGRRPWWRRTECFVERKVCLSEFARARVVSCGRGESVARREGGGGAAGVVGDNVERRRTVDLAERWRGSLVFAPAKGNERIEIEGLRLSAMELDLSYGSKRVATNDAAFGHRDADEAPLSSALRVVEIVRAGDIPSVYLSAVPPLRLRMDDVPQSRALRESLFSSWRGEAATLSADARAAAPAMVVKSQWRMKASGNYRDFADDEFSTPLLLYPVRQRRDDEGTTAMEFHLRPRRCPN